MDPVAHHVKLQALYDDIYRERIQRARSLTPDERLNDAFSLSNYTFNLMLDGAMQKLSTTDEEAGWQLVERQLQRLAAVHDFGLYYKQNTAKAP